MGRPMTDELSPGQRGVHLLTLGHGTLTIEAFVALARQCKYRTYR